MVDVMSTPDTPMLPRREPLPLSPTTLPAPSSVPHVSPSGIIKEDDERGWRWFRRKRKRRE
jgi:hypothetical protein